MRNRREFFVAIYTALVTAPLVAAGALTAKTTAFGLFNPKADIAAMYFRGSRRKIGDTLRVRAPARFVSSPIPERWTTININPPVDAA
jgi:hypothetical protein